MEHFPIFLSVIFVVRNQSLLVEKILSDAVAYVSDIVSDYEVVVVDNASTDDSVSVLKKLTSEDGLPNLQVYALTKEVDTDTASWAGLESALGDFIVVIDPLLDDIQFLPSMLDKVMKGADVVFASNEAASVQSLVYRCAGAVFNRLYQSFNGVHLAKEAPQYRVISKRVVNFILQHAQPAMIYRHLPVTGGFSRVNLCYSTASTIPRAKKRLGESIERGIRLLVSTTRMPMRFVNALCLFGAGGNFLYSIYVILIALFKPGVAPGWASLSLQQSGMFFLISLVLLVLGEYVLHVASLSNEGPLYHVSQEFTSVHMSRRKKLNVEESVSAARVDRVHG